jgi:hypothetical protein
MLEPLYFHQALNFSVIFHAFFFEEWIKSNPTFLYSDGRGEVFEYLSSKQRLIIPLNIEYLLMLLMTGWLNLTASSMSY